MNVHVVAIQWRYNALLFGFTLLVICGGSSIILFFIGFLHSTYLNFPPRCTLSSHIQHVLVYDIDCSASSLPGSPGTRSNKLLNTQIASFVTVFCYWVSSAARCQN